MPHHQPGQNLTRQSDDGRFPFPPDNENVAKVKITKRTQEVLGFKQNGRESTHIFARVIMGAMRMSQSAILQNEPKKFCAFNKSLTSLPTIPRSLCLALLLAHPAAAQTRQAAAVPPKPAAS